MNPPKLFPNIRNLILHFLLDNPADATLLQASTYHSYPLEMAFDAFTFHVFYTLYLNWR